MLAHMVTVCVVLTRQAALLESWGQTCTNELAGLGKIPISGRMHVGCHELIDGRRQIFKRALQ